MAGNTQQVQGEGATGRAVTKSQASVKVALPGVNTAPERATSLVPQIAEAVSDLFKKINAPLINPSAALRAQAEAALQGLSQTVDGSAMAGVRALELAAIVKGPKAIKESIAKLVGSGTKAEQAMALQLGATVSQWTADSRAMLNYIAQLSQTMGKAMPGSAYYLESVAHLMGQNPAKALLSINQAEAKGFSGPAFNLVKGLSLLAVEGAGAAESYLRQASTVIGEASKPFAEVARTFLELKPVKVNPGVKLPPKP